MLLALYLRVSEQADEGHFFEYAKNKRQPGRFHLSGADLCTGAVLGQPGLRGPATL